MSSIVETIEVPGAGGDEKMVETRGQEHESEDFDDVQREEHLDEESQFMHSKEPLSSEETWRTKCCPNGMTRHTIPLALCFMALIFTFGGSWDCSYFEGANISFTGNYYGLWTMEDATGTCQLWDVLFFSYRLGAPLITARVFSMTAMLLGLSLLATKTQALQFLALSWGIGVSIAALFVASVFTTNVYNAWIVFWLLTYVICTLIVRFLFIHPVHRRISRRGTRAIVVVELICAVSCILTLVVLKSDFCTCDNLTAEYLEGRDPGDVCNNVCELRAAGVLMILACALWLCSAWATATFGVQPENLPRTGSEHLYDYFPRTSIASRLTASARSDAKHTHEDSRPVDPNDTPDIDRRVIDHETNEQLEADIASAVGDEEKVGDTDGGCDEEASRDPRSCCSKACFDYRVAPRSKRAKATFWAFRGLLGIVVVLYVVIVVVLIGSRAENTNAAEAPPTTKYFILDEVCAFNPLDPSQSFETFPTKQQASDAGFLVAHCGACGFCSNPEDIRDYIDTRKTVAKKSKKCGIHTILGTYGSLVRCLEGKIGFSRDCTNCWADNMINTASKCLFTCMSTTIQGLMGTNNIRGAGDDGWLNSCLFCDERRSGPAFATCSGVARRRLGIPSEINRNPKEVCANTDVDWLEVGWPDL